MYKDLSANIKFPYILKSKMRWSKNFLEERESPGQIIIGSLDSNYCVVLVLALYLEHSLILNNQDNNLIIGIHSICKLPATFFLLGVMAVPRMMLIQEENANQTNVSWIRILIV